MDDSIKLKTGRILPVVRTKLDLDYGYFSEKEIKTAKDAVDLIGSDIADLTYEVAALICMDAELRPLCVSLIGVGDSYEVSMPVRNIIETAILSNAYAVTLIHNHSEVLMSKANVAASKQDVEVTSLIMKACSLMRIYFYDSIVVTQQRENGKLLPLYYSMRERKAGLWRKVNCDKYEKGMIKTAFYAEHYLRWNDNEDNNRYWGYDVDKLEKYPQLNAASPKELREVMELAKDGYLKGTPENPDISTPLKKENSQETLQNTLRIPKVILKKNEELMKNEEIYLRMKAKKEAERKRIINQSSDNPSKENIEKE